MSSGSGGSGDDGGTGSRTGCSPAGARANNRNSGGPIRLTAVHGYDGRANDVIYCPPLEKSYVGDSNLLKNTAVVYFGGDIQDFPENMQVHHDSKAYIKYNLENTAMMLRNNFPKSHIVVIKAVRMEFKTFSCYDHFVRGCNAGIPDHTPMNYALQHLEKILQNIPSRIKAIPDSDLLLAMSSAVQEEEAAAPVSGTSRRNNGDGAATAAVGGASPNASAGQEMDIDVLQVQDGTDGAADGDVGDTPKAASVTADEPMNSSRFTSSGSNVDVAIKDDDHQKQASAHDNVKDVFWWRDSLDLDTAELVLIAFSKGSVVLNQLIYEFHYIKTLTPDDLSMMRLVSRITDMYWLDGGHSAPKNTWITSRSLLETLTRLNIKIHVHVTPYQVLDDRRPWIRRDEKAFTDLLKRLGATLTRILHFDSGETNLFTHFEVLEVFRQQEVEQQHQQHLAMTAALNEYYAQRKPDGAEEAGQSSGSSGGSGSSSSGNSSAVPNGNNKPGGLISDEGASQQTATTADG